MSPHYWRRYVDDTYTLLPCDLISDFHDFLNSRNQNIQFTREEEEESKLAFLDAEVTQHDDGHLTTKVYRKATHTDQYLNWDSNHHLEHKRSVVRTLFRRADMLISSPEDKELEKEQVLDSSFGSKWLQEMGP